MINIDDYGFNDYTKQIVQSFLKLLNKTEKDYSALHYKNTEKEDGRVSFYFVKNQKFFDRFIVDFSQNHVKLNRCNKFRTVEAFYDLEGKNKEYRFAYRGHESKQLVTGFSGGLNIEYNSLKTFHEKFNVPFDDLELRYSVVKRYFVLVTEKDLAFVEDLENYLKRHDANYDRGKEESFEDYLSRKVKVNKTEILKRSDS